jgi:hypothetical protein
VPNQVTIQAGPWTRYVRTGYAAFFAQDQWTTRPHDAAGRAALRPRLQQVPEQTIPKDVWWPHEFVMPAAKGVDAYLDLSPRVGLAYDVFGNGKTSLKANLGTLPASGVERRPLCGVQPGADRVTLAAVPGPTQRQLRRGLRPAERGSAGQPATGGDLCGQGDANYGKNRAATVLDPSILDGWKARPYDWQFGVSVQQELMPRVSAEVGYYRRWWPIYDGVDVTDNLAVAPSEFGSSAWWRRPTPRLPNGGGYTINGLYNITAGRGGAARDNVRKAANSYGDYDRTGTAST